jgi:hypothetical protein
MTSYRVAIPSLGRSNSIQDKTLNTLCNLGVKPEQIDIFVDDFEVDLYKDTLAPGTYHQIIPVAPCNIAEKRNCIHRNYPAGTNLVVCDDDLNGMLHKPNPDAKKLEAFTEARWQDFVSNAFECCNAYGATLWGVYPVANAYFMKHNFTTDLRFISGGVYGLIVDHTDQSTLQAPVKEDYELTIKSFIKDNAVIRFNYVTFKTKVYTGTGGIQAKRTPAVSADAARYLTETWPQYVAIKSKLSKAGHMEVRLKSPWRRVYDVIPHG